MSNNFLFGLTMFDNTLRWWEIFLNSLTSWFEQPLNDIIDFLSSIWDRISLWWVSFVGRIELVFASLSAYLDSIEVVQDLVGVFPPIIETMIIFVFAFALVKVVLSIV